MRHFHNLRLRISCYSYSSHP